MTVITQFRWQCDWKLCGVMSPILDGVFGALGWIMYDHVIGVGLPDKHFCSKAHLDAWKDNLTYEDIDSWPTSPETKLRLKDYLLGGE